jgi:hypothetical protein
MTINPLGRLLPSARSVVVVVGSATALCVSAGSAEGSICFSGGRQPALRVNASGAAEVSWLAAGARRYAVVTRRGRVLLGQRMSGRDVSRRTSAVRIPLKRALKRTPDGAFWALQSWRRCGRVELHFSRWRRAPTGLTAAALCCRGRREIVRGEVTFHRRPVYRAKVYLDCFACRLNPRGWARFAVRTTRRNGSYSVRIRRGWSGSRYRATVAGPNFGWTRAPDARAGTPSARP